MLKGINKQIIEIKCPNNECFDKILLFVKPENKNIAPNLINRKATEYYSAVMSSFGKVPFYRRKAFWIYAFSIALAFAVIVFSFIQLLPLI
ncbi:MAG: hypothetical protein ACI4RC_06350 [Oscillospiraceae bacterium]